MSSGLDSSLHDTPDREVQTFSETGVVSRKSSGRTSSDGVPKRKPTPSELRTQALAVGALPGEPEASSSSPNNDKAQDQCAIRLSGLGYGAQQLGSHVDEVFGLFPESAIEITDPNKIKCGATVLSQTVRTSDDMQRKDVEAQCARPSYSTVASTSLFPPTSKKENRTEPQATPVTETIISSLTVTNPLHSPAPLAHAGARREDGSTGVISSEDPNLDPKTRKGFPSEPVEVTLKEPDGRALEGRARSLDVQNMSSVFLSQSKTPMLSPTLADESRLREKSHNHDLEMSASLHGQNFEENRVIPRMQPLKHSQYYSGGQTLDLASAPDDVPNLSHQISKKTIARSESPMLAPKPISPARQLKLKNSVPQLMKALPPLPPESSSRPASSPDDSAPDQHEASPNLIPIQSEVNCSTIGKSPEVPPKSFLNGYIAPKTMPARSATEEKSVPLSNSNAALPLPRLKLKMKGSGPRSMSPPDSRPWNLAENYPWSTQTPSVRLPPIAQQPLCPASKPPKFKLKVTRASNSSLGTVRVNRNSADSKPLAGMRLRGSKDLFTPTSGFDNVFRQVGRHLHSRRTSTASSHASKSDSALPAIPNSNAISKSGPETARVNSSHLPLISASPNPLSPTEARSVFSDDSSNVQSHHSLRLRGRLSNLRAKIAAPYAARAGTQSYDDITWRDKNGPEIIAPLVTGSIPNLHDGRKSTDQVGPMRRWAEKAHRQKLKTKLHDWLRGAKYAIAARVRSRSTQEEGIQKVVGSGYTRATD